MEPVTDKRNLRELQRLLIDRGGDNGIRVMGKRDIDRLPNIGEGGFPSRSLHLADFEFAWIDEIASRLLSLLAQSDLRRHVPERRRRRRPQQPLAVRRARDPLRNHSLGRRRAGGSLSDAQV